jgi:hypothetical protein
VRSLDEVEGCHIERVRETYPLYTLNYRRKLAAVSNWIERSWGNLTLLGRAGRFWYNNMDHSIAAALGAAALFLDDHAKGTLRNGSAYAVEDRELSGERAAAAGAGRA